MTGGADPVDGLRPGDVVAGDVVAGRYHLIEELGRGASGIVFRAHHAPLDTEVAVKILRREVRARPDAHARFEREAQVAARFEHPARVAVLDFGDDSKAGLFLVMELVRGTTLREWAVSTRTLGELLRVTAQLADVLEAMARVPLVHRDVKPDNIFFQEEPGRAPRVRLVDFGLAFVDDGGGLGRLTTEGQLAGTPEYMSPEQARGRPLTPSSDVYSLGCVLFELLSGRPPSSGPAVEVLSQQLYAPLPPLEPRVVAPARLGQLVRRMLDKDPVQRPTAAEVGEALSVHGSPEERRGLQGRAARMVDEGSAELEPFSAAAADDCEVAIVGPPGSPELFLHLGAAGVVGFVMEAEERLSGVGVVYCPGASVDQVLGWAREGLSVVTDAPASDPGRIAALARAGADEVLHSSAKVSDIASRIARAVEVRRRRRWQR